MNRKQIEKLKKEMINKYMKYKEINEEVINVSQQLDGLIVKKMREQL